MAENFYFSVGIKEKSWALVTNFREADSGLKPLATGKKCCILSLNLTLETFLRMHLIIIFRILQECADFSFAQLQSLLTFIA